MTRNDFIDAVLKNASGVKQYQLGYDGQNPQGLCDCIGLDIGALAIMGIRWPGTHGTNWAARYYTNDLSPIRSIGDLKPGDVVFKKRDPGEQYYNLPDTYKSHPDQRDYYHVGTVIQVNPLRIIHCTDTPGGIKNDNSIGKWSYHGTLQPIDSGGGKPMEKALVIADQGKTVNLREQPSKASRVLYQVPVGELVDVYEEGSEWSQVGYQNYKGWMMTMFTVPVGESDPPEEEPGNPPENPQEPGYVKIREDLALALWEELDGIFGRG